MDYAHIHQTGRAAARRRRWPCSTAATSSCSTTRSTPRPAACSRIARWPPGVARSSTPARAAPTRSCARPRRCRSASTGDSWPCARAQALAAKGAEIARRLREEPEPGDAVSCCWPTSRSAPRASAGTDHWLLGALPAAAIVELPTRGARDLAGWIRQRAALEGLTITDEAARLLVELTGEDTRDRAGRGAQGRARRWTRQPQRRRQGRRRDRRRAAAGRHLRPDARRRAPRRAPAPSGPLDRLLATEDAMLLLTVLARDVRTAWTAVALGDAGAGRSRRSPAPTGRPPMVIETLTGSASGSRSPLRVEAPSVLGRRTPAQEQWRAAGGDGRPGGRPVRGEVIGRSIALGLLLGGAGLTAVATAAERCAECVTAGAASATVRVRRDAAGRLRRDEAAAARSPTSSAAMPTRSGSSPRSASAIR